MSRDYRSEILIALIIAVILILLLAVAVLLAVVTGSDAQNVVLAETTEAVVVTSEVVPATTIAPTTMRVATRTPSMTTTPSVTATIASSSTPRSTVTPTTEMTTEPVPIATDTEDATESPPTVTSTIGVTTEPAPTATDTEQATELPPTATETATSSITQGAISASDPTETSTSTRTATTTPSTTPSVTEVLTVTNIASKTPAIMPSLHPRSTRMAVPTATLGILATDTRVPVVPVSVAASPTQCMPPSGWVSFIVQSGDTLASIARATRTSIEDIRSGNCIEDVNRLRAGQTLYAPRMPQRVTNPTGGLAAKGCQNVNALINSPRPGQRVREMFQVFGSAAATGSEGFIRYQLDIRQDGSVDYQFYSENRQEVRSDVLGEIDTTRFGAGVFWLRLVIVDGNGGVSERNMCEIPLYFE